MWLQPPAPPPPATEPTPLSGIEVVAARGTPKVVATYPAAGAAVPPGALVLMVRFDHRMRPDGWTIDLKDQAAACLQKPRLLKDEKTFVLLCSAGFRQSFHVALNEGSQAFRDVAGTPAEAATLTFTTTDAEPTPDVAEALKAAGLTEVDSPIIESTPGR